VLFLFLYKYQKDAFHHLIALYSQTEKQGSLFDRDMIIDTVSKYNECSALNDAKNEVLRI